LVVFSLTIIKISNNVHSLFNAVDLILDTNGCREDMEELADPLKEMAKSIQKDKREGYQQEEVADKVTVGIETSDAGKAGGVNLKSAGAANDAAGDANI
jgi:hypothetical protein